MWVLLVEPVKYSPCFLCAGLGCSSGPNSTLASSCVTQRASSTCINPKNVLNASHPRQAVAMHLSLTSSSGQHTKEMGFPCFVTPSETSIPTPEMTHSRIDSRASKYSSAMSSFKIYRTLSTMSSNSSPHATINQQISILVRYLQIMCTMFSNSINFTASNKRSYLQRKSPCKHLLDAFLTKGTSFLCVLKVKFASIFSKLQCRHPHCLESNSSSTKSYNATKEK